MRRLAFVLVMVSAVCAAWGAPQSVAVGKATLSAAVLDWDGQTIIASGGASLVASSNAPLKPGGTRLDYMKAETITIQLLRDANKKLAMKSASATGGVVMKAKRSDQEQTTDGKPLTIIRDVSATARSAVLTQNQDAVKLTGNVIIKITDPGAAEPYALITGEIVTVSLKDNKIHIEGPPGKQAEFTITPKEQAK